MAFLYMSIIVIALVLILCYVDLDHIALIAAMIIAFPATFWVILPHYSYETEIVNTDSYALVALYEIDDERFTDKNTYLIYDSINDDFVYYYKDSNGVVRQNSISADSKFVSVVRDNSNTIIDVNTRDYKSGALKHLLLNNFNIEWVLHIPENSEIYQLYNYHIG